MGQIDYNILRKWAVYNKKSWITTSNSTVPYSFEKVEEVFKNEEVVEQEEQIELASNGEIKRKLVI